LAFDKAEDAPAEGNLLNLPYSDSDPETEQLNEPGTQQQPTEGEQYPDLPTPTPPEEQEPPEIAQSSAEPTVSKANKINQLLKENTSLYKKLRLLRLVPAARPLGLETLAQIATSMEGELQAETHQEEITSKQREELRLASPEVFVLLQVIKIHQILIFG
jgi:uncharacterized phage infection (PIP) family protein YhgE